MADQLFSKIGDIRKMSQDLDEQMKTRFAGIQKPSTLFDIDSKKYPGCVSLSGYIKALLAAAEADGRDISEEVALALLSKLIAGLGLPPQAACLIHALPQNGEKLHPKHVLKFFKLIAPHSITSLFDGMNEL